MIAFGEHDHLVSESAENSVSETPNSSDDREDEGSAQEAEHGARLMRVVHRIPLCSQDGVPACP
jgi:hypothetical protein